MRIFYTVLHKRGVLIICLATPGGYVNVNFLFYFAEGPLLSGPTPPRNISSHAHLLDRLYDDDDEKTASTTATEARLRTQVRLRARLAAERRLAHDNNDGGIIASAIGPR